MYDDRLCGTTSPGNGAALGRRSAFGRILAPACLIVTALLVALAHPAGARAQLHGPVTFDGGNANEQAQVLSALRVSDFDYTAVAARVTVRIIRDIPTSEASYGVVTLDADLLDVGEFSWGVVQHEMAHEVDFLYLTDTDHALLLRALGGASWWYTTPMLAHGDYGCERFASELSWAFWANKLENSMAPANINDESNRMPLAAFRILVSQLLTADGYPGEPPPPPTAEQAAGPGIAQAPAHRLARAQRPAIS